MKPSTKIHMYLHVTTHHYYRKHKWRSFCNVPDIVLSLSIRRSPRVGSLSLVPNLQSSGQMTVWISPTFNSLNQQWPLISNFAKTYHSLWSNRRWRCLSNCSTIREFGPLLSTVLKQTACKVCFKHFPPTMCTVTCMVWARRAQAVNTFLFFSV